MSDQSREASGIYARRIGADNVVHGTQIQGDDKQVSENLIALARDIKGGRIEADQIAAKNLVSGLQYITNPTSATAEDIKNEVRELRIQLDAAIAKREIADPNDQTDVRTAISAVESELDTGEPNGSRITRKLSEITDILVRTSKLSDAAGTLSSSIAKLAPIAATIGLAAQHLFGG
jgi:hypothetical protein